MKLSDLPIVGSNDVGLAQAFDFVRLNKCTMEFMPRFNVNDGSDPTSIPNIPNRAGRGTTTKRIGSPHISAAWQSQASEDSGVTECTAYDHARITPDYIRGMQGGKETEFYKRHKVHFTPTFYDYTVQNVQGIVGATTGGAYKACKKQWVNTNYLNQGSGSETQTQGPDFYGPMYCFSNNLASGSQTALYDVKLHYSVSFRRLRGI